MLRAPSTLTSGAGVPLDCVRPLASITEANPVSGKGRVLADTPVNFTSTVPPTAPGTPALLKVRPNWNTCGPPPFRHGLSLAVPTKSHTNQFVACVEPGPLFRMSQTIWVSSGVGLVPRTSVLVSLAGIRTVHGLAPHDANAAATLAPTDTPGNNASFRVPAVLPHP